MRARKTRSSQATRKRSAPTASTVRSAITNGSHILADVDGRSAWHRRFRDLIQDHTADLGGEDTGTDRGDGSDRAPTSEYATATFPDGAVRSV